MASDTDKQSGVPHSTTDPAFPGPPPNTTPGMPSQPEAHAEPQQPTRNSARPPRAESIDELLDGLGGEGQLPRKPTNRQSHAPRKPAAPVPVGPDLPSVLVRPDSDAGKQQPDGSGPYEDDGRPSEVTVLTPGVRARRSRVALWIAGIAAVVLAILALAGLRKMTQTGDEVPPAGATIPTGTGTGLAPTAVVTATAPTTVVAPTTAVTSTITAAPDTARVAPPPSPAKLPASAAPSVAPRPSSDLDDFRRTIQK